MFILEKKRSFGTLINDTFSFFRATGKHFFKNFFLINGSILLIIIALCYIIFRIYADVLFSSIGSRGADNPLEAFLNNNVGLAVGTIIFVVILFIFFSMLVLLYPPMYMKLYREHAGNRFTVKDMIQEIRSKIGKIILFFLSLLLLSLPIFFIYFFLINAITTVSPVFFLGILVFYFVIVPIYVSGVYQSLYHYLLGNTSLVTSYFEGFNRLFKNFWPIIGSTTIMFIIMWVASTIATMIPYFIMIAVFFTSASVSDGTDNPLNFISIVVSLMFILIILVQSILNNLILVNQGIIYFSVKEQEENNTLKSDIDLIGTDSE